MAHRRSFWLQLCAQLGCAGAMVLAGCAAGTSATQGSAGDDGAGQGGVSAGTGAATGGTGAATGGSGGAGGMAGMTAGTMAGTGGTDATGGAGGSAGMMAGTGGAAGMSTVDLCPADPDKTEPGVCGCGATDDDDDDDGTPNCNDMCPDDKDKIAPGVCGCGESDADDDTDGTPNCNDMCPDDDAKTAPGMCGCGESDADSDADGTPDCDDGCPTDAGYTTKPDCGCPSSTKAAGSSCNDGWCASNTQCDAYGYCGSYADCYTGESLGITAGHASTCALKGDGTVWCWGDADDKRLGRDDQTDSKVPVQAITIADATQVSCHGQDAGDAVCCALRANHQVMCWGHGTHGEIGNGGTSASNPPTAVMGLDDAIQVSAGSHSACAVRHTGEVACWGYRLLGRIGDGDTSGNQSTPTPVSTITDAVQVAVGSEQACAVLSGGQIMCWGQETFGKLGNASGSGTESRPVLVQGITNAVQVDTGWGHSCAVLADGTAKCWGYNAWGQLGDGSYSQRTSPATVTGLADAKQISAGYYNTCATTNGGSLYCWGWRFEGRVGDNGSTAGNQQTPVLVKDSTGTALTMMSQVSMGYGHGCATTTQGDIHCWGDNLYGKLGNNSTTDSPFAIPITLP